MPIYPLIKTFWKPLLVLLIVIISIIAINWYGAKQYNAGVTDATATMQVKMDNLITEQAARMALASKNYQELKTAREIKQGIQYVEVEKIIDRPIYTSDCIDADGMSQINRAAAGR